MKLFAGLSPTADRAPATPAARIAIADMPLQLFEIFSRLENRNNRLHSLAVALGGHYPCERPDVPEAPTSICQRVFYDMENILAALDEMDDHMARLEHLYGIDPDTQLATPIPPEMPPAPEAPLP